MTWKTRGIANEILDYAGGDAATAIYSTFPSPVG
jgi:hypothetical protein